MPTNLPNPETVIENELHEVLESTSQKAVSPDTPEERVADSGGTPELTWLEMSEAFDQLKRFSDSAAKGHGCDWTCNFSDAIKTFQSYVRAREGLEWIKEELAEHFAEDTQYHREESEKYSALAADLSRITATDKSASDLPHGLIRGLKPALKLFGLA